MKTSAVTDALSKLTCASRRTQGRDPVSEFAYPLCLALAVAAFGLGTSTIAAAFGANDAAATLSGLTEGARYNAIASLVRSGQLRGPVSAAEGALILSGTLQGSRAASINEMASLFKADLTGQEGATVLGPANALSEGNRYNAIAALARAKRFGPSLGGDADLLLDGTTQGTRASAIGEIAPYLRTDLRGQQVAAILGSGQILGEGNRYNAIAALARANRVPQALTAAEAVPILAGTTKGVRAAAIAELARFFVSALSGEDVAAILGRNGETAEGDRLNALAALARAGKLRPGLSGQEMTLVLEGMSGQTRATAVGEMASAASRQAATTAPVPAGAAAPAQPVDPTTLAARIERRLSIIESAPPYAYDTGSFSGAVSTVWMDMTSGALGTSELRQQYEQFYFAALEYRTLAIKALLQARRFARNGQPIEAEARIREADRLIRLFGMSKDGATQAYLGNSDAAATVARGIYEGSRWALAFGASVSKVASPAGIAMIDGLFVVTDFYVDSAEIGQAEAQKRAKVNTLTLALMQIVPIPDYNGQTLSVALEKQTTKALGSSRLFRVMAEQLKDPTITRTVLAFLARSGAFGVNALTDVRMKELISAMESGGAS